MPSTIHQAVTVNLNVNIDASGNIDVFGQEAPSITNKIVATTKLPVRALYDASGVSNSGLLNSLFEFWEPSDALGTRRATLAASEGRDFNKLKNKLVMDLQSVLMGEFDCSDAKPFKTNYTVEDYYKHPHFGRVALSSYAHYLFGHVAATAAITNDAAFMGAMMSTSGVSATSPGTYTFASTANVNFDDVTPSTLDAKLALRLVNEIITKDDTAILAIVEQVLGQDASRAMDEDNNALAPGGSHPLKFIAGDKIYLNIRLRRPNVTISNGGVNAGAPDATQKFLDNTDTDYTLEITLDDIPGAVIVPPGVSSIPVETISTIYSTASSLTVTEGSSVNVSTVYNLSTVSDTTEQAAIRNFIVNTILTSSNVTSFTTTASALAITTAGVPTNLTVINPEKVSAPVSVTSVNSTTGVYVYLNRVGASISFTDGSDNITITQTGQGEYSYDGQTYNTGDTFTFGGKTFVFGSVLVKPTPAPAPSSTPVALIPNTSSIYTSHNDPAGLNFTIDGISIVSNTPNEGAYNNAARLFNRQHDATYTYFNQHLPNTLTIDFGTPKTVTKMECGPRADGGSGFWQYSENNLIFEASTDGVTYTTLGTITDLSTKSVQAGSFQFSEVNVSSPAAYRYYRLRATAGNPISNASYSRCQLYGY